MSRLLILCLVVLAATVTAFSQLSAQTDTLLLEIEKKAELVNEGTAANLTVTVACPDGWEVLEAFVYINQDGNSTDFARIPIVCDAVEHSAVVRVNAAPDQLFHKGKASASGFILIINSDTGETLSLSPSVRLKLK